MTVLNKFVNSKIFIWLCVLAYAVISIVRVINHIPFADEAHAWSLAENLTYAEMFNEVKNEGHFFLWQTMLYPFAKLHLYPYSMQILNWIFCTLAIILLWWKAPFNNVIKALITFSFPFLGCYSVISRCYALGIFLLFALASLYDKKLQYPKTYALLLVLCANTSVMALIGASAFGLMFLYDLIKQKSLNKKDYAIVSVILTVGVGLILYQLLNIDYFLPITSNRKFHVSVKLFRNVFVYDNLRANCLLLGVFSIPILKYIFQNKSALFFITYTYFLLLAFVTAVYGGYFWHSYFFFIYLIISFWICQKENIDFLWKNVATIALGVVSFVLISHKPTVSEYAFVYGPLKTKTFLEYIEKDENLNRSQIIQNDGLLMEARPYTSLKKYTLRTHCDNKKMSDVSLMTGNDKFCAIKRTIEQAKREPDTIKQIVESYNGDTYTYFNTKDYDTKKTFYNVKSDSYSIYFEKYKCYDIYCFWKIEIK